jgi:hypothetical protein
VSAFDTTLAILAAVAALGSAGVTYFLYTVVVEAVKN